MTLLAYLALVVAVAALCCGHQGEPFPPFAWWRSARQARRAPEPPSRHVPSWAPAQSPELSDGPSRAPKPSTDFLCTRKDHP